MWLNARALSTLTIYLCFQVPKGSPVSCSCMRGMPAWATALLCAHGVVLMAAAGFHPDQTNGKCICMSLPGQSGASSCAHDSTCMLALRAPRRPCRCSSQFPRSIGKDGRMGWLGGRVTWQSGDGRSHMGCRACICNMSRSGLWDGKSCQRGVGGLCDVA